MNIFFGINFLSPRWGLGLERMGVIFRWVLPIANARRAFSPEIPLTKRHWINNMDSETYNNDLLGKPHFSPYFPNKTTSVANRYCLPIPTSLPYLKQKNEVIRLREVWRLTHCY